MDESIVLPQTSIGQINATYLLLSVAFHLDAIINERVVRKWAFGHMQTAKLHA